MNTELELLASRLAQARTPEEVFGGLASTDTGQLPGLKQAYRQMAKVAHPDRYPARDDQQAAKIAFTRLTDWFTRAEQKIRVGEYGKEMGSASSTIRLHTRKREYRIAGSYEGAGLYNIYPGYFIENGKPVPVTLNIVRDPADNDLAQNEARILRILEAGKAARKFSAYLPTLVDTFQYEEGGVTRQANVFVRDEGWYSLEEVHRAYPAGVDPKDMAWMWRRLLVALGFAHLNSVLHGAVLPGRVFILPGQHGLKLAGWSQAVCEPGESGERIRWIDPAYADWYPVEILRNETPLPGMDIFLAARSMTYLLGGDPVTSDLPDAVPGPIRVFLKTCTFPGKRARPQDAWKFKEEFDELLTRLWGERKFHPFVMP